MVIPGPAISPPPAAATSAWCRWLVLCFHDERSWRFFFLRFFFVFKVNVKHGNTGMLSFLLFVDMTFVELEAVDFFDRKSPYPLLL